MTGEVGILNVGAGDTKLSFDPKNPAERIRAARIVKDMIRRGYALLVKVGDEYRRATDFDESACEYIIADFDPVEAETADAAEAEAEKTHGEGVGIKGGEARTKDAPRGGRRGKVGRVPAASTNAVAVARSAGG